jgi:hypothetical protein
MKLPDDVLAEFRKWGAIGGKRAADGMSKKAKSLRAKKAVTVRELNRAKRNGAK